MTDKERINAVKAWFACRNEIQPEEVFAEIKERKENGRAVYRVKYSSPIHGDIDKIVEFPDEMLNEFCQYLEECR